MVSELIPGRRRSMSHRLRPTNFGSPGGFDDDIDPLQIRRVPALHAFRSVVNVSCHSTLPLPLACSRLPLACIPANSVNPSNYRGALVSSWALQLSCTWRTSPRLLIVIGTVSLSGSVYQIAEVAVNRVVSKYISKNMRYE
jgi:hypothetical protein